MHRQKTKSASEDRNEELEHDLAKAREACKQRRQVKGCLVQAHAKMGVSRCVGREGRNALSLRPVLEEVSSSRSSSEHLVRRPPAARISEPCVSGVVMDQWIGFRGTQPSGGLDQTSQDQYEEPGSWWGA